jgi:hypothetical protein
LKGIIEFPEQLTPAPGTVFAENVGYMELGCPLRDAQARGDFLVTAEVEHELKDAVFGAG